MVDRPDLREFLESINQSLFANDAIIQVNKTKKRGTLSEQPNKAGHLVGQSK